MRLVDRIKYRWTNYADPLPGELEPWNGMRIVRMIGPPDSEKSLLLRRLRALLFGYGPGWTFKEAFMEFFFINAFLK